jgi:hypothetical protein
VTLTSAGTTVSIQEVTWLRKRVVAHLIGIEPAGDDATINLTLPDGSTLFVALCADGCPPTTVSVKLAPLVPRAFFAAGAVVGSPNLDNVLNEVTWSANPERLQSGVVFDTVSEPFASLRPWLDPVIGFGSAEQALWFVVVATLIIIGRVLTKMVPNFLVTSLSARIRHLASGLRWPGPRRDEPPSISAPSSAMDSLPVATSSVHSSSDRR